MSDVRADPAVADYLARLDRAARILPEDRRFELLDEIAAHIAASEEAGSGVGPADVRSVLERLGAPEEIVAAAQEQDPVRVPPRPRAAGTGLEIAAVLLLTVGSVIPVLGWLAGVVLLWSSRRWRPWEKALGTLVVPGGPFLALALGLFIPGSVQTCTSITSAAGGGSGSADVAEHCTSSGAFPHWAVTVILVAWVLAPFVVGVILLTKARRRAAVEDGVAV